MGTFDALYNGRVSDAPLLLCLDFGTAKVGVAIGSLIPSTPLQTVRYTSRQQLIDNLTRIVSAEKPDGILIGWPADHLTVNTAQTDVIRRLGEELGGLWQLPVVYYPETLSTQLAQRRMIAEGVSKQRRREVEDGYAAAVILDDYLRNI